MFNFIYGGIDFAHKLDAASNPTEQYFKHVHAFHEVICFVEGDVEYTVESETRRLVPGDLVVVAAGRYHFATVNPDVRYERYVLKFPSDVIPAFLAERIQTLGPFLGGENALSFAVYDTYYGNYSDEELKALYLAELVKFLVTLSKEPQATPHQTNTTIAAIVRYIDEHIRLPITLEGISEEFHFSKSYISNEFKRYMKISVMQYVRLKKIIAAHRLILTGKKKSYVAEEFGFENYSTFYRQYLKLLEDGSLPHSSDRRKKQGENQRET